jgi:hypothetical protein
MARDRHATNPHRRRVSSDYRAHKKPRIRGVLRTSRSDWYQVALRGAAFLAAGGAFFAAALAGAAFLTTGPVGVVIALCGRTLP